MGAGAGGRCFGGLEFPDELVLGNMKMKLTIRPRVSSRRSLRLGEACSCY